MILLAMVKDLFGVRCGEPSPSWRKKRSVSGAIPDPWTVVTWLGTGHDYRAFTGDEGSLSFVKVLEKFQQTTVSP
jgi:hypothetical protein